MAMATGPTPTVRLRKLGIELRKLREAGGLTLEQAGGRLERTPSSLSKIETGRVNVRPRDLRVILDQYGLTDQRTVEALLALARDGRRQGWWQPYRDVMSSSYLDFFSLEADAASIQTFETLLIPGLLQTEDYSRAVIAAVPPAPGKSRNVDQLVTVRIARQEALTKPNPVHLWAILSEAVLRQEIGGRSVMRDQLKRLLEAGQRDHITVQILPYAFGAHASLDGPFTLLEVSEPTDLRIVLVEYLTSALYLEQDEDVRRYTVVFDHLRASALAPKDSLALIADAAEER